MEASTRGRLERLAFADAPRLASLAAYDLVCAWLVEAGAVARLRGGDSPGRVAASLLPRRAGGEVAAALGRFDVGERLAGEAVDAVVEDLRGADDAAAALEGNARAAQVGLRELAGDAVDVLGEAVGGDLADVRAMGWVTRAGGGGLPEEVSPGEVPLVRSGAASGVAAELAAAFAQPSRTRTALAAGVCELAARVMAAAPFFLDAATAAGLLASDPPEGDVLAQARLPAEALLVWSAPLRLPEPLWLRGGDDVTAGAAGGGAPVDEVAGLWVAADEAQRPTGQAALLLRAGDGAALVEVGYAAARQDAAAARAVWRAAANATAALAFARWNQPPAVEVAGALGSTRRRKALRRARVRTAARGGALAGVRVIDVADGGGSAPSDGGGEAARRPPSPHLRRGHWRRVRVGPRDGWRYEARWVPPTVVGGPRPSGPSRVWRLPPG